MMREKGIDTTKSPDAQWKSSLDAVKKRLENQITDLTKQIKTGEKSAPKKGIEYDREAKVLQSYRDALKTILELTEEKKGIPPEQRTRMALKAAERAVSELERKLSTGDMAPRKPTGQTPVSPELKAMRDKRDALQKQLNEA